MNVYAMVAFFLAHAQHCLVLDYASVWHFNSSVVLVQISYFTCILVNTVV